MKGNITLPTFWLFLKIWKQLVDESRVDKHHFKSATAKKKMQPWRQFWDVIICVIIVRQHQVNSDDFFAVESLWSVDRSLKLCGGWTPTHGAAQGPVEISLSDSLCQYLPYTSPSKIRAPWPAHTKELLTYWTSLKRKHKTRPNGNHQLTWWGFQLLPQQLLNCDHLEAKACRLYQPGEL